jgi:hydrogenase nickel incorporation protein HypB
VLIISKSDLVPHFDFDMEKIKKDALSLNPSLKVFVLSAKTGEGFGEWIGFLKKNINHREHRGTEKD